MIIIITSLSSSAFINSEVDFGGYYQSHTTLNAFHHNLHLADENTKISIKPVLLTYSKLFFEKEPINMTTWNFLSVQEHLIVTGIPYRVLSFSDIADIDLNQFSVVILVDATYVNETTFNILYRKLTSYIHNGGNVISVGYPPIFCYNETGHELYNDSILFDVFNANNTEYIDRVSYDVLAGNLTTLRYSYELYEPIWRYTNNDIDIPVIDFVNKTYPHYVIAWANRSNTLYPIGVATDFGTGKSAYFSMEGYYEWLDATLILTRTIQWCIFGDKPPVSMLLTPGNLTWMFTVDADLSSITEITKNATSILLNISQEYRFPFSWGIVTGPFPPGMAPNWTALAPYYEKIQEYGNELAGHSRTHPTWKYVPLNDTARVEYEVGGCKQDILNNLSINIEVFHTPDGYFYEDWYPILAKYYNFTITVGSEMTRLMGGFYFPHIASNFFIFWRSTESDFDYFHVLDLTNEEIVEWEMSNFKMFYKFHRAIPYINLWHDYTLNNASRLPVLLEILKQQLVNTSGVYTIIPKELENKLYALTSSSFDVSYFDDKIEIILNTSEINEQYLKYLANMAFLVEGSDDITGVFINNNPYYAFTNDRVILPEITSQGVINITLLFSGSESTHVVFSDVFIKSLFLGSSNFTLDISNTSRRYGKIIIWSPEKPKFIFVGSSYYSGWSYNGGFITINVTTLDGPVKIVVYYAGDINLQTIKPVRLYLPQNAKDDFANINVTIISTLNHTLPLYATVEVRDSENETLSIYTQIVNVSPGVSEIVLKAKRPYKTWINGNFSVLIVLTDNFSITYSKFYSNAIIVIDTVHHYRRLLPIIFGIIVIVLPLLGYFLYRRFSKKKKEQLRPFGWLKKEAS
ncbi:MAG: hypothetical protein ACP6IU_05315 [Candidatus Asgardarchaeia archaeon]